MLDHAFADASQHARLGPLGVDLKRRPVRPLHGAGELYASARRFEARRCDAALDLGQPRQLRQGELGEGLAGLRPGPVGGQP
jgi:hypothetical protein